MARKPRIPKRKTAVELHLSTGSPVAVAAFARGGAGRHGGSDRARNRRDRNRTRQALRRGDF